MRLHGSDQERAARIAQLDATAANGDGPLVDWYESRRSRLELVGGDAMEQAAFNFITSGLAAYLEARATGQLAELDADSLAGQAARWAYASAAACYTILTGQPSTTAKQGLTSEYIKFLGEFRAHEQRADLEAVCRAQFAIDTT